MDGEKRRKIILERLMSSDAALSATKLAKEFNVSRQIVVGDIALLRASGTEITATNKGYILGSGRKNAYATLKSIHKTEDVYDELCTITDLGAKIIDVYVEHPLYGRVTSEMNVSNRYEARTYAENFVGRDIKHLSELTGGIHYHTIEAKDQVTLLRIQKALNEKGYLVK